MKIDDIKKQLSEFDDDMEIFYNEPIIGALVPMDDWNLKKALFIQTKDGQWFTEDEFEFLKKNNEKFESDVLLKKEQAYLYEDMPDFGNDDFLGDTNFLDDFDND